MCERAFPSDEKRQTRRHLKEVLSNGYIKLLSYPHLSVTDVVIYLERPELKSIPCHLNLYVQSCAINLSCIEN